MKIKKSVALANIINSTSECLRSIEERDLHPEIKEALKASIIEHVHIPSIKAVEERLYKNLEIVD